MIGLKQLWLNRPLTVVLVAGFAVRLIGVIFSGGYGYHDDHFLVIEPAQSWLEGLDRGNMITDSPAENSTGRSLLYPFANYILFGSLEFIGIEDPSLKMLFNRLIHALYSLLTVLFGYKLAEELAGVKEARIVGLLLAVFWLFPQMSVRNLVEVVPIPLLMLASYETVKYLKHKTGVWSMLFCGVLIGLSFSLRYQTILFGMGLGLGLLLKKEWRGGIYLALSTLLTIVLLHGIGDYFLCGEPFCKLQYYISFNVDHATDYTTEPWHFYLVIILGTLIPPLSLLFLFGFLRSFKISTPIWLAILGFFIFHSMFPNKQERFIFTIMPHLLLMGYLGWHQYYSSRPFSRPFRYLVRFSWIFFWILNIPLVILYSAYDNKHARVWAMQLLAHQKDFKGFILADPNRDRVKDPPLFYLGNYDPYAVINRNTSQSDFLEQLAAIPDDRYPNYLIINVKREEGRIPVENELKKYLPNIKFLQMVEMGRIDNLRNQINSGIGLDDWAIYQISGNRLVPFDPSATPLPDEYR
ncbi:MAG: glycosyltransferase family 39 protein [Cyclobacteriaceae bacterium]